MAISQFRFGNTACFIGLSTDTKASTPAATAGTQTPIGGPQPGDTFMETDTGNTFQWNGAWVLSGQPGVSQDLTALSLNLVSAGTTNSSNYINNGRRMMNVGINIGTITGTTPTLTVTAQGQDVASGTYYTLLASTALAATGFTLLQIGPSLTAAANSVANANLPRTWRISAVAGGTVTSIVATIGVSLV
jgi:hypothetical protein